MRETDSLRGRLLIAGPSLVDSNFARTVVLVGEHNADGALGVVLNRPSETTIAEAVPDLTDVAASGDAVYVGGPVQPSAVLVLAEYNEPAVAGRLVCGPVGFLAVDEDEQRAGIELGRARVYAGYAGWGAGQLESELELQEWIVCDASVEDVFDEDEPTLWNRVLERQGGRLALLSRMPVDPTVN